MDFKSRIPAWMLCLKISLRRPWGPVLKVDLPGKRLKQREGIRIRTTGIAERVPEIVTRATDCQEKPE